MIKQLVAAATLAMLASSSFAAAPTEFYAGADLDSVKFSDLNGHKTGLGGFVGYGFNPNVAVELGYRQTGSFDVQGVDVKAKQTHLSLVGSYPLTAVLDVYGRLGYNKVRADATYQGVSVGVKDSGVLYGVGLNYSLTSEIDARVEVQKPHSDTTVVGVGILFKF